MGVFVCLLQQFINLVQHVLDLGDKLLRAGAQHAGTQGGEPDEVIAGNNTHAVVFSDLIHKLLDIGITGFSVSGVGYADVVHLHMRTGVSGAAVPVKDQHQLAPRKAAVARKKILQALAGKIHPVGGKLFQCRPGIDQVVAVDNHSLLPGFLQGC